MTKDEINQVLNAMDGFYVGYANVSTLKESGHNSMFLI